MKPFIALQSLMYICFLILDLTGKAIAVSNHLKLATIALCFSFAIVQMTRLKHKVALIQALILLFTFVSDYFLLMTDAFSIGITTFIIVQIGYGSLLKLAKSEGVNYKAIFIVTIVLILTVFLMVTNQTEGLSLLYAILFIRNLARAYNYKNHGDYSKWLFIGLSLYAVCDVQVALFNLESIKQLFPSIYVIASMGMWAFYLPGQVILTLSPCFYKEISQLDVDNQL
ncbi:MAG: hypothetical protein BGO41_03660 [Clostridiales bacterium 38-18]|nr:MAG: hypothetical protein BGO41_03660 [Clostridiales bacterium 38-18]